MPALFFRLTSRVCDFSPAWASKTGTRQNKMKLVNNRVCLCVCVWFFYFFLYISSLFWEIWMLIHSSKSKLYSEDFAAKIMQSSSALDLVFISPSSHTYLLIQIKDESAACEIYIDICSMYIWVSGLTVAHLSANPLKYPAHTVLFKCNI